MEIIGMILKGKSYKTRVTERGSTEVKFSIKTDKYHNFKTYVDEGMEIPPFLKEGQDVKVETEGGRPNSWDWKGKTYSDLQIHLSMIRRVGGMDKPKEEIALETPPCSRNLEEPEETEKEMWARKTRQDFRGRCLVYSIETYKISEEAKKFPWKKKSKASEIQEKIQTLADRYLNYIYEA